MVLEGDNPRIQFHFYIVNCAVYSVTFDPVFEGSISYGGRKLEGAKASNNSFLPHNLPHGWISEFALEQELSSEDAEFIKNAKVPKAYFDFRKLRITVRGDCTHRDVPPTMLRLTSVAKDGGFSTV